MKERIVIVIIAIGLGLFLTTIGFLIYQSTKFKPNQKKEVATSTVTAKPTETPAEKLPLEILEPKDEAVVDRRTVTVKGQTDPSYTVVISSNQEDVVATPDSKGTFTASVAIDAGTNQLITKAIKPDGTEIQDIRVVTYSTEEF